MLDIHSNIIPTKKLKECVYLFPIFDSISDAVALTTSNEFQIIDPHGSDINSFLVKKHSENHKRWNSFQE